MGLEEVRLRKGDVDTFPIGIRVLAVDDDPICLKLLDGLLRKCQYHVTTTNQARVALNMLRENRDRFDLVISDVHMPDMDGFNLLEQVGLELDLPVIMLSANSDPRLVLQGVTHGACDYLVKPVRLEELRNIWQHVIRRKKRSPDQQNKTFDEDKFHQRHAEGDLDPSLTCNSDHNGKLNKKRKDDEAGGDENELDNEDPASQKKPRVVWSIDLHRKFVTAVNHLGIEKAVPKRILDMMNVEGLTRENVASHLQKYRLYLRRISSNATHQANLVAALGSKDAYMRMGSLDGSGTYHTLARSGRLANTVLSPYTSSGMLGRLNSPIQNFTSSGIIQPSHAPNFNGSMNNIRQFPSVNSSGNHNGNLIQGTPSCLSLDQLNFANSFPNFDQLHGQRWGEHNHNHSQNSGNILSTLNSQLPTSHGDQSLDHINFNRQIGMPSISQSNGGVSTLLHQGGTGRLSTDPKMRSNSDYFLGQTMQHGAFTSHDYDSFDDLMTVMVKLEHDTTEIGGGFALDAHSF